MTKLAAVLLALALPGLVAADMNRLRLSPDPAQPDALTWDMRTRRRVVAVAPSVLPAWASVSRPDPYERGNNRVSCPCPAAQRLSSCFEQPECRRRTSAPMLWPYSPRSDERKTRQEEQVRASVQP
jgi:hypothetical protein